jgi:hypothetical protein
MEEFLLFGRFNTLSAYTAPGFRLVAGIPARFVQAGASPMESFGQSLTRLVRLTLRNFTNKLAIFKL